MPKYILFLILIFSINYANAQKLHIGYIFPAGGKQGSTFIAEIGGQGLAAARKIIISGTGARGEIIERKLATKKNKNSKVKEQENNQLSDILKIKVTIGPNAEPGIRDFLIETPAGFSNHLFFDVNTLPEFSETEPNDKQVCANKLVTTPVLVNGCVMPGDADVFKFKAEKGRKLVCYVKARRLKPYMADAVPGWFQSVLILYNSKGKEVAYNDDYFLQPDAAIIYEVQHTDTFYLEIRDAIYRGREDFVYRIAIGEIPFIKSLFPLGGQRGKRVNLQVDGINIKDKNIMKDLNKNLPSKIEIQYKTKDGLISNAVPFEVSDEPDYIQTNGHDLKNVTDLVPFETVCNGIIDKPGTENWFTISGKQGESVYVKLMARRLQSPLDAEIVLYDMQHKVLARNDDMPDITEGWITHQADPELIYKFAYTGKYIIRVTDIQGKGGSNFAYRLHIGKPQPKLDLRIEPSNITINRDGTAMFTIYALRKNNFDNDIHLEVKNLPEGFTNSYSVIEKGHDKLQITISAPAKARLGEVDIKVIGKVKNNGIEKIIEAEPVEGFMQAFAYTHYLPVGTFMASVAEEQPFSIRFADDLSDPLLLAKGDSAVLKVRITRKGDFNQPVLLNFPPVKGIKMRPVTVLNSDSIFNITIHNTNARPNLSEVIILTGQSKITKGTKVLNIRVIAPAIHIQTPKNKKSRN